MQCTKCDSLITKDAKFCSKCGNPASIITISTPKKKPNPLWLYFVSVMLFGLYASAFIPAMSGKNITGSSINGILVMTTLFFYLLWRNRERKGWHGALIGFTIGFLAALVASTLSVHMSHNGG